MNRENEGTAGRAPEEFIVDLARPEDAAGIVRLFQAVYGDGYPVRLFYDADQIIAANREGRYYSIVARTPAGGIVGATHLYRPAPCPSLYEWGAGLVLPEYRNRQVNKELAAFLHEKFVPGRPEIAELFGEPVCNHLHMQKAVARLGYVETALEVALMPAESYPQEKSAAGRVAALQAFRCCKAAPHRIFLPPAYAAALRLIYARLDDDRNIALAGAALPADRQTQAGLTVFDLARVARIAVRAAGGDLAARLAALEAEARAGNVLVCQVWLNLTEPWAGEAADILRERGYFFGGALPRWFGGDGLLLQKLACPPDFAGILLHSEEAKQLLDFIRRDWERTA